MAALCTSVVAGHIPARGAARNMSTLFLLATIDHAAEAFVTFYHTDNVQGNTEDRPARNPRAFDENNRVRLYDETKRILTHKVCCCTTSHNLDSARFSAAAVSRWTIALLDCR